LSIVGDSYSRNIGVKKNKIEKDRGTVCFREDVDDLLNNLPTELDKYVINKEIQYTGNFLFFIYLKFDTNCQLFTRLYDKRDDFNYYYFFFLVILTFLFLYFEHSW
jgi:hypothetical protein